MEMTMNNAPINDHYMHISVTQNPFRVITETLRPSLKLVKNSIKLAPRPCENYSYGQLLTLVELIRSELNSSLLSSQFALVHEPIYE